MQTRDPKLLPHALAFIAVVLALGLAHQWVNPWLRYDRAAVAAQAQGPTKVEVPFGASDVLDEGAPVVVPEPLASEVDAQYRAAKAAGNRRDFQEARERFTEVLRLKPDHLEADLSLGVVLMVLGESEAGRARLLPHVAPAAAPTDRKAPPSKAKPSGSRSRSCNQALRSSLARVNGCRAGVRPGPAGVATRHVSAHTSRAGCPEVVDERMAGSQVACSRLMAATREGNVGVR